MTVEAAMGILVIMIAGPFRIQVRFAAATVPAAENRLHPNPVICWWIPLFSFLKDPS
jgi:hypothetical protein